MLNQNPEGKVNKGSRKIEIGLALIAIFLAGLSLYLWSQLKRKEALINKKAEEAALLSQDAKKLKDQSQIANDAITNLKSELERKDLQDKSLRENNEAYVEKLLEMIESLQDRICRLRASNAGVDPRLLKLWKKVESEAGEWAGAWKKTYPSFGPQCFTSFWVDRPEENQLIDYRNRPEEDFSSTVNNCIWSPDHARCVYLYRMWGDADAEVDICEKQPGKCYQFLFSGPSSFWNYAFWLDDNTFVLIGESEERLGESPLYHANVNVYRLEDNGRMWCMESHQSPAIKNSVHAHPSREWQKKHGINLPDY
ncbi:MAG TPA: hypothetical protein VM658_02890 [bacterium]|nr:hypothetical protein [bacterium]